MACGACLTATVLAIGPSAEGLTRATQLWVARYNGPANGGDDAYAVAVSPDGSRVFVTGASESSTHLDYATVAYNASTGHKLWVARYNGPARGQDVAFALAVSPDGSKVFATGESDSGRVTGFDYATVGYDASTGAKLWAKIFGGPQNDEAFSVAASPNGSRVFVTGVWGVTSVDSDYATVAYDASTGAKLWVARHHGPVNGINEASSLALSPDGLRVFVTGRSDGAFGLDYATVAYDAATGAKLWVARYNGPGNRDDLAFSLGVSPDGSSVFVTGWSDAGGAPGFDYATVAYEASTGVKLWAKRYNGPGNGDDQAYSVAVSPDGSRVFVTGGSDGGSTTKFDYATVAYEA